MAQKAQEKETVKYGEGARVRIHREGDVYCVYRAEGFTMSKNPRERGYCLAHYHLSYDAAKAWALSQGFTL